MTDSILHVTANVNKFTDMLANGATIGGKRLLDDDLVLLASVRKNKHSFVLTRELLDMSDTLVSKKLRDKTEASESGVYMATDSDMVDMRANLAKVSHLIRLPYNNCIFEREQMSWCFEFPDGYTGRRLIYAYVNTEEEEYTFSLVSLGYDAKDGAKFLALPNTYSVVQPYKLLSDTPEDFIMSYSCSEEVAAANNDTLSLKIVGALLALNSPKIVHQVSEKMITSLGTSKKKPIRSGVIKVDVSKELKQLKKADDALEEDAVRRGMRAHFVRGHFKTKPSGVYWWNAFVRGVGEAIEKPYVIKAS